MIQDKDRLNPTVFFLSILFLTVVFSVYLHLRPIPANPEAYTYLANLRALTETGRFFGVEEPVPLLILSLWKSLLPLNYLTAFQSLAALVYSLSLHLIMLLFRREKWTINHYFLVYFSAFVPYSHDLPTIYFNELLGILFILLLFHTFRMETILDLLLFPLLVFAAFLADLRTFLLGFSIFLVIQSIRGMDSLKARSTVFYKKKNVPLIILLSYLGALSLFLVLASVYDFFGESSFATLLGHWMQISIHILPAFLLIAIGKILLGTEKELRTLTFTAVLVVGMLGTVFFNYSRYDAGIQNSLELTKEELGKIQPRVQGMGPIYTDSVTANYQYFQSKSILNYTLTSSMPEPSLLYVSDLWQADVNEIQKRYIPPKRKDRRLEVIPMGQNSALLTDALARLVTEDKNETPWKSKIQESHSRILQTTPYARFLQWQQKRFGYKHLQNPI